MSVARALQAKQAAAFGAGFAALLAERGLTPVRFAQMAYGMDKAGVVRSTTNVRKVCKGKSLPRAATIKLWAEKLGMTAADLFGLADGPVPHQPQKRIEPPQTVPNMRSSVVPPVPPVHHVRLERPTREPPPAPRAPAPPPEQFAFVVGADGRASIRLDMPGLPLDVGLKVLASLTAAGLLGTPRRDDNTRE